MKMSHGYYGKKLEYVTFILKPIILRASGWPAAVSHAAPSRSALAVCK